MMNYKSQSTCPRFTGTKFSAPRQREVVWSRTDDFRICGCSNYRRLTNVSDTTSTSGLRRINEGPSRGEESLQKVDGLEKLSVELETE